MIMSGKCSSIVSDSIDLSDDKGVVQDLPLNVHALLVEMYKSSIPRYSELSVKYEEELRKAANRRQKSTFPPFNTWIPVGGLQSGDLELLKGPDRHACVCKRLLLKDKNTGRLITYAADKDELNHPRFSCSYVQVLGYSEPPRLGQIKLCFTHTFYGQTHEFVLLNAFTQPQLDAQCGLWWIHNWHDVQTEYVLKPSLLSSPLVVANEEDKLWFLTVSH